MAKSTPAGKKRVVVKKIARSAIHPAKCKGKSAKKQEAGSDKQEQMHAVEKILDHRYNIEGWLELLLEWKVRKFHSKHDQMFRGQTPLQTSHTTHLGSHSIS